MKRRHHCAALRVGSCGQVAARALHDKLRRGLKGIRGKMGAASEIACGLHMSTGMDQKTRSRNVVQRGHGAEMGPLSGSVIGRAVPTGNAGVVSGSTERETINTVKRGR